MASPPSSNMRRASDRSQRPLRPPGCHLSGLPNVIPEEELSRRTTMTEVDHSPPPRYPEVPKTPRGAPPLPPPPPPPPPPDHAAPPYRQTDPASDLPVLPPVALHSSPVHSLGGCKAPPPPPPPPPHDIKSPKLCMRPISPLSPKSLPTFEQVWEQPRERRAPAQPFGGKFFRPSVDSPRNRSRTNQDIFYRKNTSAHLGFYDADANEKMEHGGGARPDSRRIWCILLLILIVLLTLAVVGIVVAVLAHGFEHRPTGWVVETGGPSEPPAQGYWRGDGDSRPTKRDDFAVRIGTPIYGL